MRRYEEGRRIVWDVLLGGWGLDVCAGMGESESKSGVNGAGCGGGSLGMVLSRWGSQAYKEQRLGGR